MAEFQENLKTFPDRIWRKWLALDLTSKAIWLSSLVGLVLLGVVSFALIKYENYVPLFTSERLQKMDVADIVSYLQGADIPYHLKGENLILVPPEKRYQIRMELGAYGLPKAHSNKGFELFDSNTWIKGEKELQVLELRALIGQLEQDLSHFDNIRSANVILDVPSPRPFGAVQQKPKASVIVKLKPGARLGPQEIRAITNHVSSAVRGLSPNMVAISDTTGKLYQSMDPDGDLDILRNAELAAEEHIKTKIDGMLVTVVGFDNYYSTVQVVMNREKISQERKIYSGTVEGIDLGAPVVTSITESNAFQTEATLAPKDWLIGKRAPLQTGDVKEDSGKSLSKQMAVPVDHIKITTSPGKIENISIGVLIDESVLHAPTFKNPGMGRATASELKKDLESQIATILKGYGVPVHQSVDFVQFDRQNAFNVRPQDHPPITQEIKYNKDVYWLIPAAGLLFLLFLWALLKYLSRQSTREANESDSIEKMIDSIRLETNINPAQSRKVIKKWLNEDSKTGIL